ncbi:MAG: phosphatase PAP2 family protein, partial [Myxococcota bacterium]
ELAAPETLTEEEPIRYELDVDVHWELGVLALSAATFGFQAWLETQENGFPAWDSAGRLDRWVRDNVAATSNDGREFALSLSDNLLFVALPLSFVAVETYDIAFDQGTFGGAALDLYTAAIGGFLAVQISQIWKRTLQRSRPEVFPVGDAEVSLGSIHSFPSGHAMNASAFAASFVTQRYLRNDPNWPYYAVAGGALSVATGIARIRSDNHWATDVAAGLVMGTAVGIAYPLLTRVRREARDDEDSVMFVLGPRNAELVVRF